MNLIDKYIGVGEINSGNDYINEIFGAGMATVLDFVKGADVKKLSKAFKKNNIRFGIVKGQLIIGDDDVDPAEDLMVKIGIRPF